MTGDQRSENAARIVSSFEAEDGYPTDGWLDQFLSIGRMGFSMTDAAKFLARDLLPISRGIACLSVTISEGVSDYGDPQYKIEYHTGGWSGAEALIGAMLNQFWIHHFHTKWQSGGHFYFEVPKDLCEESPAMITAADQASASSPEPFSPEPTSSEQGGR